MFLFDIYFFLQFSDTCNRNNLDMGGGGIDGYCLVIPRLEEIENVI